MDAYSSGEELIIKTRKPYTITKQRERWTDEEHSRFLEALKLYGRAWQRIEEHIGTKTAVQIRSHAQKFFSKLEKEALIKGVPLGHAFDIDIPPPRPKRKPSNPYPRKTNTGAPSSNLVGAKDRKKLASASSLHASEQLVDLENDPPHEKPSGTEKSARTNGTLDDDNCSEVLTLFHQEVPCASISSVNKSSIPAPLGLKNPCTFREFVPSKKEVSDHATIDESNLNVKPKENQKLERTDVNYIDLDNGVTKAPNLETSCLSSHEKPVQGERTNEPKKHEKLGLLSANEMQTNQKYPRHVPVQFVNGISGTCLQTPSPNVTYPSSIIHQMGGAHGNSNLFANEHNMSRSSIHQSLPTFSPSFTPLCNNQDNYRSFLNSTFSSLIVSTLLLNPAAHAAASLAASFWPCTNVETMEDSPSTTFGGFPFRSMSPSPSIAAIAAATVAAASAWWAAHGLVPVCPPLHSGFSCTPAPTTGVPSIGTDQAPVINKEIKDNPQDPPQQLDPDFSEPLKRRSASKSPPMPSSDSETGGARPICTEVENHVQQPVQVTSFQDPNNVKNKKQVDRSSCGSNTPSSSEVETDALEKHEKGEEESKELDLSPAAGETNNRRGRTTININESWKEVSEEGRLAFQALFNREVLPQSFSPPHDLRNKEHPRYSTEEGKKLLIEKDESGLQFDLSNKTWGTCPDSGMEQEESLRSSNNAEELVMTGLGHAKLKARRTGFKPYKRCSLEAKESRVANGSGQGEEKGPKRIRLGGEAST